VNRLAIVAGLAGLALGACSSGAPLAGADAAVDRVNDVAVAIDLTAAADVAVAIDLAPADDVAVGGDVAVQDAASEPAPGEVKTDSALEAPRAGGGILWSALNKQSAAWYGGASARELVANVLYYQNADGGWPKNIDMTTRAAPLDHSTIDNDATTMELVFLAKVVAAGGDATAEPAFLKGVDYLLAAQYANGGWPQFYPDGDGYHTHITFNDGATAHVLTLLRAIAARTAPYSFVDGARAARCATAFTKGVDCILACQIVEAGVKTGWCAQHDEVTLEPAKARAYELPSESGLEGAGLLELLMTIDAPTPAIVDAVQSGIRWFKSVRLTGVRVKRVADATQASGADVLVIADPTAPPIWARFYELGTNRPFFCDRDGIPKYTLAEIGNERRTGYDWYTDEPTNAFTVYASWQPKWAPGQNVLTGP
jgi:pectinesterase